MFIGKTRLVPEHNESAGNRYWGGVSKAAFYSRLGGSRDRSEEGGDDQTTEIAARRR